AIPDSGEDPYASDTYMGAMRTGIERLQSMFEGCQLVLITPNFIKYNNFGTNPVGETESVYEDYVNAVRELGGEYALPVLDFYMDMGIDRDNFTDYLQDEIHPNETSRFNMGMHILDLLRELLA
ncbi:MAG: SGNH/GDSL hydrolase family protein, partial [Acetatifactor sp.]|nr:SGNH/GDSL hydrolase family protein [Acetatifactor sp.]